MKNYFFSFSDIHELIKKTVNHIKQDDFKPDYILAIGSGGYIPARIIKTFLDVPIISVTLSSYCDEAKKAVSVIRKIQWIDGIDIKNKKLLIVDDIDDTRLTMEYCLSNLLKENPAELRVFILHNKLRQKAGIYPDEIKKIYVAQDVEDYWIHYPWESQNIEEFDQQAMERV